MSTNERSYERRLRRTAERRGYILSKSRRRDPEALDYGRYWLAKDTTGAGHSGSWRGRDEVLGGRHGVTLEEVETWLNTPRDQR